MHGEYYTADVVVVVVHVHLDTFLLVAYTIVVMDTDNIYAALRLFVDDGEGLLEWRGLYGYEPLPKRDV